MRPEDWEYLQACCRVRAAILAGRLGRPADRPDIEQQLLLRAWKSLDRFESARSSFRTFADRVTGWEAGRLFRAIVNEPRFCELPPERSDHGRTWRHYQLERDVAAVVETLPPELRQIVDRLAAGESCRVIAVRLNISRHRLTRAYIGALRARFKAAGLAPSGFA